MRRPDRPGGQDNLPGRAHTFNLPPARELHADGTRAVEQNTAHQGAGNHFQVLPLHRRPQIAARRTGTAAAATGLLHPADAVAGAGRQIIDVLTELQADLLPGLDRGLAQLRLVRGARGEQRPALAVHGVGLALPVLRLLEDRLDIVPRPAAVAELAPMVEILRLATDIDQAIDRTGTAEHPPARKVDGATRRAGIRLGLVAPGQGRMFQQLHIAGGNMDQRIPVAPTGLDQQHAIVGVLGQPVGEHAARRAGADDDVIRIHLSFSFPKTPA